MAIFTFREESVEAERGLVLASGNIHSANFTLIAFSERKEEEGSCFLIFLCFFMLAHLFMLMKNVTKDCHFCCNTIYHNHKQVHALQLSSV